MARGITGKTKTRVETLISWVLAFGIVGLLAVGLWYVATVMI